MQCPSWEAVPKAGYGKKAVFKHRGIKPLFLFKLHFNELATLEMSAGRAGLE